MSGGHAHGLYVHGDSIVHRTAAAPKMVAVVIFAFAVVVTPRDAFWAFGLHVGIVGTVAGLAGVGIGFIARRLALEIPFVAFALMLPFVAGGREFDIVGLGLSVEGLWAAWNIIVKALISGTCLLLLAATTTMADLLRGLHQLRAPRLLVMMMGFMVRYVDVISGEFRRMSIARTARGGDERWLWKAKAWTSVAGAVFIRSFERGERVHLAMLARGYTGDMPEPVGVAGGREAVSAWGAAVLPITAVVVASLAVMT